MTISGEFLDLSGDRIGRADYTESYAQVRLFPSGVRYLRASSRTAAAWDGGLLQCQIRTDGVASDSPTKRPGACPPSAAPSSSNRIITSSRLRGDSVSSMTYFLDVLICLYKTVFYQ
ncbi:MAG: hypothetical protein ACREF9_04300, partial [Opitutaceae bacterium]